MPLPIPCAVYDPGTSPSWPMPGRSAAASTTQYDTAVGARSGLLRGPSHTRGLQACSEGRTLIPWLGGLQGRRTAVHDARTETRR